MRERQAAQLAAAFILRAGRPLGALKLMKLMYLAEREAMSRFVFPIVFDDIFALQRGMALSRTFKLLQREPGTPTNGEWDLFIGPTSHRGIPVRHPTNHDSLDSLSRNDIEVIDYVWGTYGKRSQDALIHEVHHALPEWVDSWEDPSRKSSAVPMSYERLFQTLRGMNAADAVDAAAEVAYFKAMGQSGGEKEKA